MGALGGLSPCLLQEIGVGHVGNCQRSILEHRGVATHIEQGSAQRGFG
jgi:hypothetical protein